MSDAAAPPADGVPPHPDYGIPQRSYVYRRADGSVAAVKCYFKNGTGEHTATLALNGVGLTWKTPPLPMSLYGAEIAPEGRPAVLCFDEQAANLVTHCLPEHISYAPITPHPEESDLSPFKGADVLIWAPVGSGATAKAWSRAIKALALSVKILKPPPQMPIHWDAAEAVLKDHWGATDAAAWLARQKIGEPHVREATKTAKVATPAAAPVATNPALECTQFQILGHGNGRVYVVPSEGGQVLDIPMGGLGKPSLLSLAPLQYWETTYACKGREGWDTAANAVIRTAYRAGVYDACRVRGRGAWWDDGRCVLHLGNRLLVDGVTVPVREMRSRYTYEVGAAMNYADAEPLSDEQARRFPALCDMLSWHRQISASFLAGWCVIAPICGALDYRPHAFLTGQAASGKTWTLENIVNRMIGQLGLFLAATTSEPGIRRALRCDARPVIIDELEGSDARSVERIKSIFHLFRYATSETGAEIVMARVGGGIETFRPRFCGATSAIGSLLSDYADVTRHTTLSLRMLQSATAREAHFAAIKAEHRALLTPEYIAGMQARIVRLIPTIRENAETFAAAGAQVLGARRIGDQIGALMAGRYACQSTHRITEKAAIDWIQRQDWDEEREIIQDTDGPLCLAYIMQHKVQVDAVRGRLTYTIGDLCEMLQKRNIAAELDGDHVVRALRNTGVVVDNSAGVIWISNTHKAISEIMRGTPWPANWGKRLKAMPTSISSPQNVSFGAGASAKAIGVRI